MKALEKLNNEWQNLFQKQRVRMVATKSFEFVDFIKNGKVTDIYWTDPNGQYDDWEIEVEYKEGVFYFKNVEDGDFLDESEFFKSEDDIDIFYEFLYEINPDDYINDLRMEKLDERFKHAQKEHVGLVIERVEKQYGNLIYYLKNGEKLTVKG